MVVDSLRADRLEAYGGKRGLTPFLDRLAADSLVFEHAYSPSSWTLPSVATLFLGRYPTQHQVVRFHAAIPDSETTLAEVLASNGYVTSGFTANAAIAWTSGFAQGFEHYQLVGDPNYYMPKSNGRLINDAVLRHVDVVGTSRPHFIYLHYMDPHAPYLANEWTGPRAEGTLRPDDELNYNAMVGGSEPDAAVGKRQWTFTSDEIARLEQLYDGEVRFADALLSELFTALTARGLLDNAIVIVTADHGEEFGEHGVFNHGVSLHEAAIRVPLLIHRSDTNSARIPQSVETAGVAARLLLELGIDQPAGFTAPPLPLEADTSEPAYALSELLETKQYRVWLHRQAIVSGRSKVLVDSHGGQTQYELEGYAELSRRATLRPDMRAALDVISNELAAAQTAPDEATLDEATVERLRGLGYAPVSQ